MMTAAENTVKSLRKEVDAIKIVRIALSRWYLPVLAVLITLLIAHIYLWLCPKTYSTSGMLKFEEKKPELSDLVKVMSHAARTPPNLQSEKFIIHSRSILLNAIKKLNYPVSFYAPGKFRDRELYPQKPLNISLLRPASLNDAETCFTYKPINRKTFNLSWNTEGQETQGRFRYNSPINISNTRFSIQYPGPGNRQTPYLFKFNTPESLLERVHNGLQTSEPVKNSNVINLWQRDANPHFAADILNAVMTAYLDYDQHQKTQSATQMIRFIEEQLVFLRSAVKNAENAVEQRKQNSGVMDIRISTNHNLTKLGELESQRSVLKIQEIAIKQLKARITADQRELNLNFNLEGQVDQLVLSLLNNLNNLLSDKNILLSTYSPTSSAVSDVNEQIERVKNATMQNISASALRIGKNISYLDSRLAKLNREIAALPATEKNLLNLERNFEINEKIYSFLSEKKLETQVNRAAILPGATIIEQAQFNEMPLSPNKPKVYRTAIIAGLLAGIVTMVLLRVLNPYIYNKERVEEATNIPIAGVIRKFPGKTAPHNTHILDLVKPRTVFAESVRAVRTYLNFLPVEKQSKVICITSEVAGEGKSFIALQLSATMAMINKKVILISADLRRPKLHLAFGLTNNKGLSNYLYHQNTADEIIRETGYENLDFISSGPVHPQPAELLHSEKLGALIDELRTRYDVILIDTAPVGLVADAIPLLKEGDINLFVIRYGVSKYTAIPIPEGLAREYHLKNMVIVLNAFEENRLHAGYYKGYPNFGTPQYYTDYSGYANSAYYEKEQKSS